MTDDIDVAFGQWAEDQLDAAGRDMPSAGPFPSLVASRRSRNPRFVVAVACLVLLIAGLSFTAARLSHRGAATTPPSACSASFRPSALQPLGEVGEIVDLDLTYTGKTACVISTAPPRVTLTDSHAHVYPISPAAVHSSTLTLHRGEVLTVSITGFACGTLPKDRFVLHIYLGATGSAGVAVGAGVHGGSRAGKPNYCGASENNGAVQALQTGIGTSDRYRQADRAKPNPRAGVGREWGLIQVTDAVRTVAIPYPSRFTFQRTANGQVFANDSVNSMGGTYIDTSTGFLVGSYGSTLAGYSIGPGGPVPIAVFTAIRAIDAIGQTQGGVEARESNGVLDLHVGGYKLIFKDLGPAHSNSPVRGG